MVDKPDFSRHLFEVGDIVECVTQDPPCGCAYSPHPECPQPEVRKLYRVSQVGLCRCNKCYTIVSGMNAIGLESAVWAWPQACFRPIKGTEEIDIFKYAIKTKPKEYA